MHLAKQEEVKEEQAAVESEQDHLVHGTLQREVPCLLAGVVVVGADHVGAVDGGEMSDSGEAKRTTDGGGERERERRSEEKKGRGSKRRCV